MRSRPAWRLSRAIGFGTIHRRALGEPGRATLSRGCEFFPAPGRPGQRSFPRRTATRAPGIEFQEVAVVQFATSPRALRVGRAIRMDRRSPLAQAALRLLPASADDDDQY